MSDYSSLFSAASFPRTIQKYCGEHGWDIADLNDQKAKLRFEAASGNMQILYVIRFDTTLEFSVPSKFTFPSEDEVPHRLSTILMGKNAELKVGFWCLERIQGEFTFSIMHNQDISLLDSEWFGGIVRKLVGECDDFEVAVDNM
jgi:hypothetical protein